MLSVVRMGRSKLQLYLEDDSTGSYIFMIKDLPMLSAHRENLGRMYWLLEQSSSSFLVFKILTLGRGAN